MYVVDQDAITAVYELAGRTGATAFEIGYLRDEDDPEFAALGPGWYAHAQFRGARIIVENLAGPTETADALARRLLDGGTCNHCKLPVSLMDVPGTCRWTRMGPTWVRGCEGSSDS